MSEYQNNPDYAQPAEGAPDWSPYYDATMRGQRHPMHEDKPEPGYYCIKLLTGERVAVAFWHGANGLVCVSREPADKELSSEGLNRQRGLWMACARHAIRKALCCEALFTGRWADLPQEEVRSDLPDDPAERVIAESLGKMEYALNYKKNNPELETKDQADFARNLEAQLQTLKKKSDETHKTIKAPVLAEYNAIDERFRYRDKLAKVIKDIRSLWETFDRKETKRLQAEADAQRQKEIEELRQKQEEERLRQEAEREQLAAAHPGIELPEPPPPAPEPIQQPAFALPITKTSYGGGSGKRASLGRSYTGKIVDLVAAYTYYQKQIDPIIEREIQKLIDAEIKLRKADTAIPGVEIWDDLDNNITAQRAGIAEVAA